MANVTLSIPDQLLKEGRKYALKRHTSLNALIRELLSKTVQKSASSSWLEQSFELMDAAQANSKGRKSWKREDLYDV